MQTFVGRKSRKHRIDVVERHCVALRQDSSMPYVSRGALKLEKALVAAGSLAFADALRLVRRRGELMQEAVPEGEGAMAAILGLDDDVVADCCEKVEGVVSPANYNAPSQVVIAGTVAGVDGACGRCRDLGARRTLPFSIRMLDLRPAGPLYCM